MKEYGFLLVFEIQNPTTFNGELKLYTVCLVLIMNKSDLSYPEIEKNAQAGREGKRWRELEDRKREGGLVERTSLRG